MSDDDKPALRHALAGGGRAMMRGLTQQGQALQGAAAVAVAATSRTPGTAT